MSWIANHPRTRDEVVVDVQLTGSHRACLAMLEALHEGGFPVENASAPYWIGSSAVRMSADVVAANEEEAAADADAR